jgi:ubiquitin C-terminal hydrolase
MSQTTLAFRTGTFSQYSGRGITSLKNLGNTCFMNAAIQCLTHTYELSSFLEEKTPEEMVEIADRTDEGVILKEWEELRRLMFSDNCAVSPMGFLKNVHSLAEIKDRQIFTGFAQNDLTEFILFLCDCFHEALKRSVTITIRGTPSTAKDQMAMKCFRMIEANYKSDYSEIFNMFYGIQVSSIKPHSPERSVADLVRGASLSDKPESFFMLDLPIPALQAASRDPSRGAGQVPGTPLPTPPSSGHVSIYDCFDEYCKAEVMDGENRWLNEETGEKQVVVKALRFFTLPDVLVVCLKRFTNSVRKNNTPVAIDVARPLDLSKYVCGYEPEAYQYEVFGVCDHMGNVMGGHYTATVKNADGSWWHFDDLRKKKVEAKDVISKWAYCLFMRKLSRA